MHSNSISNCARGGTRRLVVGPTARAGVPNGSTAPVEGRSAGGLVLAGARVVLADGRSGGSDLEGVLESGRVVQHRNIRDRYARHPSSPTPQQLRLKRDGISVAQQATDQSKAGLARACRYRGCPWRRRGAGRAYARALHEACTGPRTWAAALLSSAGFPRSERGACVRRIEYPAGLNLQF